MEPSIWSLVPPLLAIGCALWLRNVLIALFLGVFAGALLLAHGNPLAGLLRTVDTFIVPAVANPDHAMILVFSLGLGGLVGIVASNGGTRGLVDVLVRRATTARGGQTVTWLLGLAVFFDDYANCLLVGNSMRPVTDRLRISREKLAFIVDSTAAPVSAIMLSTWLGYEIGLIGDAMASVQMDGSAFAVFLAGLGSRFYPIVMLAFVFFVARSGRDFGPMLAAERRAYTTGKLLRDGATPAVDLAEMGTDTIPDTQTHWRNAVLPIATVVAVTLVGLYTTGRASLLAASQPADSLMAILSASASGKALLWGTLLGTLVALRLTAAQRILSVTAAIDAWVRGIRSMMLAMIILVLAWALGAVTVEVKTAEFLVGLMGNAIAPEWIASITFLLAAAASFATGTSWGTMAILMPIVIPLYHATATAHGMDATAAAPHFLASVSAVLAGAIFGDHCSPISDTTVLSSMSSACDHIDHTRTQLPYALAVAAISLLLGYVPVALGVPPWAALCLCLVAAWALVRFVGQPVAVESQDRQRTQACA